MLGDAEEEESDVPIITDLDPPPKGQVKVRFVAPPKTFIVGTRPACLSRQWCPEAIRRKSWIRSYSKSSAMYHTAYRSSE